MSTHSSAEATPWRMAAPLAVAALAALLATHAATSASLANAWGTARGFSHGFFVLPISAWLVYRKRREIAAIPAQPTWLAGAPMLAFGGLWLAGSVTGINVACQFALVGMAASLLWGILGTPVFRALAFPVAFLFFAVPIGEQLIPTLIEITARFTFGALRISGVPVHRVGNYLRIPGAEWLVAESCSGLRYLLTIIMLSTLYAYLTYRSLTRRVLLVAASVAVAIFANGLRAYLIIMIGLIGGSPAALAADHAVYGLLLFGIVATLFFWVAGRFREDEHPGDAASGRLGPATASAPAFAEAPTRSYRAVPVALALLAVAAAWPLGGYAIERSRPGSTDVRMAPPDTVGMWTRISEPWLDWKPSYSGARASFVTAYESADGSVIAYVGYYRRQHQGYDLVRSTNRIVEESDPTWKIAASRNRDMSIGARTLSVRETDLRSRTTQLRIWEWYWVDGRFTERRLDVKRQEVAALLGGRGDDAAVILVASRYEDGPGGAGAASARLARFLEEGLPRFQAMLEAVRTRS